MFFWLQFLWGTWGDLLTLNNHANSFLLFLSLRIFIIIIYIIHFLIYNLFLNQNLWQFILGLWKWLRIFIFWRRSVQSYFNQIFIFKVFLLYYYYLFVWKIMAFIDSICFKLYLTLFYFHILVSLLLIAVLFQNILRNLFLFIL
jgi:hypothetical protein